MATYIQPQVLSVEQLRTALTSPSYLTYFPGTTEQNLQYLLWNIYKGCGFASSVALGLTNGMYAGYAWTNIKTLTPVGQTVWTYQAATPTGTPTANNPNLFYTYTINQNTGVPSTTAASGQTFNLALRPWFTQGLASTTPTFTAPYPSVANAVNNNALVVNVTLPNGLQGVVAASFTSTGPFAVPILSTQLQKFNTQPFVVIYVMTSKYVLIGTNVNEVLNSTKTAQQASNTYISMSANYLVSNKVLASLTPTTQVYQGNVICVSYTSTQYKQPYTVVTVDYKGDNTVASIAVPVTVNAPAPAPASSTFSTYGTTQNIAAATLAVVLIHFIVHVIVMVSNMMSPSSNARTAGRTTEPDLNKIYTSSNPVQEKA